jgi:hypothetical protein
VAVLSSDLTFGPRNFRAQFVYVASEFLDPEAIERQRFQPAPFHERFIVLARHHILLE